jgi:four helix bundle protein
MGAGCRVSGDGGCGVITDFGDLRVWQLGMDLVEDIYRLTQDFPANEMYGLTNQMRRAAVSVPSNIAEGHARRHLGEYLHHISIAQGSLAELYTQSLIAERLVYAEDVPVRTVTDKIETLRRQLHALRNALSAKAELVKGSAELYAHDTEAGALDT